MPTLNLTADFWGANRGRFSSLIEQHAGIMPTASLTTLLLNQLIELAIEERRTVWAWVMKLLSSPKVKAYLAEVSKNADERWDWAWIADERIRSLVEANDDLWQLFVEGYSDVRTLIEADVRKEEERKEEAGTQLLAFLRGEAGGAAAPFGLDLSDQRPKEITPPEERIPVSGQAEASRLREMQKQLQQMQQERDEARREANDLAAQMAAMLPDDEPAPAAEIIDIQPIEESFEEEPEPDLDAAALMLGDDEEEIEPPSLTNPTDTPQPRSLRTGRATGQSLWTREVSKPPAPKKKSPPTKRLR